MIGTIVVYSMKHIMIKKMMHIIWYKDLVHVQKITNHIYIVERFFSKPQEACTSLLLEKEGVFILGTLNAYSYNNKICNANHKSTWMLCSILSQLWDKWVVNSEAHRRSTFENQCVVKLWDLYTVFLRYIWHMYCSIPWNMGG